MLPAKVDDVLDVELGGADLVVTPALHHPHLRPLHRETVRLVPTVELTAAKQKRTIRQ